MRLTRTHHQKLQGDERRRKSFRIAYGRNVRQLFTEQKLWHEETDEHLNGGDQAEPSGATVSVLPSPDEDDETEIRVETIGQEERNEDGPPWCRRYPFQPKNNQNRKDQNAD